MKTLCFQSVFCGLSFWMKTKINIFLEKCKTTCVLSGEQELAVLLYKDGTALCL